MKSKDRTDLLVVVSKVKRFIKSKSGKATSESVMELLTLEIEKLCMEAIKSSEHAGRKTVMGKDLIQGETWQSNTAQSNGTMKQNDLASSPMR